MSPRTTLSLALTLALAACATSTPLPEAGAPALAGSWTLQEASGLAPIPDTIRLVLRDSPPREGKTGLEVSGYAGVNHYRGTARLNTAERQLFMGPLAATRMAGPASLMQFEGAFLQQLEKVANYQWQDADTLQLRTVPGDTLTFVRSRH
ncbi:MAG: META domain-containing protein [Pseudomonadota bacterium]